MTSTYLLLSCWVRVHLQSWRFCRVSVALLFYPEVGFCRRACDADLRLFDNISLRLHWVFSLDMQATTVSADGEQTAADAERSRKGAEDLELYVRSTLLAAEGTD